MNKQLIGVDVGGTKVLFLCGRLERKLGTGLSYSPEDLENHLHEFIRDNNINPTGVGIAFPGLIANNSMVAACDVLPAFVGWKTSGLTQKLRCPIHLINDVDAALAEECADVDTDFTGGVIMVGTAVGASFITHGKKLRGASGWAGELGYVPLFIDGKIKRVDELCGGSFLAEQLGISSKEMAQRAEKGETEVLKVVQNGGFFLGIAVAGLINIFNPCRISFGGGTMEFPGYWDAVLCGAKEHTLSASWSDDLLCKVKVSNRVAALGAQKEVLKTAK
jgi:glucokinase